MRTLLLAAGLLSLSAGVNTADACSCPPLASAADQAAQFDLIFVGTPTQSINLTPGDDDTPPPPPSARRYETHFDISRVLKGDKLGSVKILHNAPNPMSCGVDYNGDAPRLILAKGSTDAGYSTWFCSLPQYGVEDFDAALGTSDD